MHNTPTYYDPPASPPPGVTDARQQAAASDKGEYSPGSWHSGESPWPSSSSTASLPGNGCGFGELLRTFVVKRNHFQTVFQNRFLDGRDKYAGISLTRGFHPPHLCNGFQPRQKGDLKRQTKRTTLPHGEHIVGEWSVTTVTSANGTFSSYLLTTWCFTKKLAQILVCIELRIT